MQRAVLAVLLSLAFSLALRAQCPSAKPWYGMVLTISGCGVSACPQGTPQVREEDVV